MTSRCLISLGLLILTISGCVVRPGQMEVGAFRVPTRPETTELERLLEALTPLKASASTLLIYDASGSMRWPMSSTNDTPRFEPGQKGIVQYVQRTHPEDNFGLVIFGHRLPSGPAGSVQRQRSCDDIELLLPLQQGNRETMVTTITALQRDEHRGDTPLETAIRRSIDVLKGQAGAKRIILITDGNDECGGNPYVAAREAADLQMRVYTIAFGIGIDRDGRLDPDKAEEVRRRLIDAANVAGGKFFDAQDTEALYSALLNIELAFFTYTVEDKAGRAVTTGSIGETLTLDAGKYHVVFHTAKPFAADMRIKPETTTKIFIALSADGKPEMRQVFEPKP